MPPQVRQESHAWRASGRALLVSALLLGLGGAAFAEDRPASTDSGDASVRLLDAGRRGGSPSPDYLAGVQIRLGPGTITYWRNPGDGGMAPVLDTAGSTNVASVRMDYPAPTRFDEGGAEAFGYRHEVVFPLHVVARDPGQPVVLDVKLAYALCAVQCLPAQAHLSLPLSDHGATGQVAPLEASLAHVPRETALGQSGAPSILSVETDPGSRDKLMVVTRATSPAATLFPEPPEGWYLQVGGPDTRPDGMLAFPVAILQKPKDIMGPLPLRLTLVDGAAAIETGTSLPGFLPVDGEGVKP